MALDQEAAVADQVPDALDQVAAALSELPRRELQAAAKAAGLKANAKSVELVTALARLHVDGRGSTAASESEEASSNAATSDEPSAVSEDLAGAVDDVAMSTNEETPEEQVISTAAPPSLPMLHTAVLPPPSTPILAPMPTMPAPPPPTPIMALPPAALLPPTAMVPPTPTPMVAPPPTPAAPPPTPCVGAPTMPPPGAGAEDFYGSIHRRVAGLMAVSATSPSLRDSTRLRRSLNVSLPSPNLPCLSAASTPSILHSPPSPLRPLTSTLPSSRLRVLCALS